MSRKAFNFYNSHWLQIKLLKDKQKLELYNAICSVQFLEINIEDIEFKDPISNIVWTGIKHSIQTSLNGFITKQVGLGKDVITPLAKGIENPMQAPYVDPYQQEKGKEKEEVKGKEKEKYFREFAHLKISKEDNEKLLKEYTQIQIDDIYNSIENYKKNTGYVSLYLTALKWLKKEHPKNNGEKIINKWVAKDI